MSQRYETGGFDGAAWGRLTGERNGSVAVATGGLFGVVYAAPGSPRAVLEEVAREFSPRIEVVAPAPLEAGRHAAYRPEIVLDLGGLARLFGDARTIAEELRRTAADRGLRVRVAMAATRTAARALVRQRAGITVLEPGREAAVLAPLPLDVLATVAGGAAATDVPRARHRPPAPDDSADLLVTLRRWGLRTLGDLAALPPGDVAARLGQEAVRWQRLARGEDARPLVPAAPEERFEQALDLEWPLDGLEPLSFVLGRLLEPLALHLERRGRGAAVLYVRLHLVTRTVHERALQLPAPMRDARTLRTLALLDLESHPPSAAIDRVVVGVDPTPARVVQFSLLTRALPSPEQLSTLMARLQAVMGQGRCGSPAPVDSWQPGAFEMTSFAPVEPGRLTGDRQASAPPPTGGQTTEDAGTGGARPPLAMIGDAPALSVALRRFRFPVPARVRVERGRPVSVTIDRRGLGGGGVTASAGPWRTSGGWWHLETPPRGDGAGSTGAARSEVGRATAEPRGHRPWGQAHWDRDEWDVTLTDGATYRLFRERDVGAWFVEGVVD